MIYPNIILPLITHLMLKHLFLVMNRLSGNFWNASELSNALFGRGFKLAKLASYFVDFPPQLKIIGPWLRKCHIQSFNARFLDVGCGSSSRWLNNLKALGFHNLLGVDPYIESDVKSGGISILKTDIQNLSDKFDLVTLHHSLEHIPNQAETLRAIRSILKPSGFCIIRIPLVSSLVWKEYGTDWVELDAPRNSVHHIQFLCIRLMCEFQ